MPIKEQAQAIYTLGVFTAGKCVLDIDSRRLPANPVTDRFYEFMLRTLKAANPDLAALPANHYLAWDRGI